MLKLLLNILICIKGNKEIFPGKMHSNSNILSTMSTEVLDDLSYLGVEQSSYNFSSLNLIIVAVVEILSLCLKLPKEVVEKS